jgi:hypothetical protein
MNETVENAALQEFTEVAQSIPKLAKQSVEMPVSPPETLAQKMSRVMKDAHARKRALGQPWKTKKKPRPYVRRQPVGYQSVSQIDAKIHTLLKQVTVLREAKKLLTR